MTPANIAASLQRRSRAMHDAVTHELEERDPYEPCALCDGQETVVCQDCNGAGRPHPDRGMCYRCRGTGEIPCECVGGDDDQD